MSSVASQDEHETHGNATSEQDDQDVDDPELVSGPRFKPPNLSILLGKMGKQKTNVIKFSHVQDPSGFEHI